MKRLSLIFTLSIVLLSFGLANAITFEVEVDATKKFTHPESPYGEYYMGNTPVFMNLKMANDDGIDHTGFSQTHKFYSTNGDGTAITWLDGGGEAQAWDDPPGGVPSIVGMNGWLDDTPNPGDDSYFSMMAQLTVFSWDGSLPDTMNFTTASTTGWLSTNTDMETRFQFHFSVPTAGPDQTTDIVEICIDQSNGGHPDFDWLFPVAVDFMGPYCFEFLTVPNLPPVVTGTPLELTTEHDVPYSVVYGVKDGDDPTEDDITAVVALDETATPIGTVVLISGDKDAGSFSWYYDPPCSWVTDMASHTVTFYAEDNVNGHYAPITDGSVVSLKVTNTAPEVVGPCPRAEYTAALGELFSHDFDATDDNEFDEEQNWSVVPDVMPADGPSSYDIDGDGNFTFTPNDPGDDGIVYTFTVTVTDCAGGTGTCDIPISCSSLFPFGMAIEYEDGNNNDPDWVKGGIDGEGHYLGQHAYVDVMMVDGTEKMLGFDFMISYDNSALAAMGAYPNPELFEGEPDPPTGMDCDWEYFTYRFVYNCGGSCPSGLLQIIAIADQNDGNAFNEVGDGDDECFYPPGEPADPFVLFTIDFFVSNDYTLECSFIPVSFYWTDCTDNSIAFSFRSVLTAYPYCVKQGISLYVLTPDGTGSLVYEAPYGGFRDITDPGYGFPGGYGAPDDPCDPILWTDSRAIACVNDPMDPFDDEDAKFPIRFVNFFNGGVKIICNADIDDRGDLNLNGVRYEIADAVVFTNYFIYGMAAFETHPQGQKAASDVNADGIPLSVADLVYLIRVIVGDILPIDKLNPNMVEAHFGHDGQLVTVDVELGAALFVLEGNVDVSLAQDAAHMDLRSGIVNGNTQVLVYSFDKGATFSGNILNTEGRLISVEAADYNSSAYKAIALPTSFSVENYPNPFNAATTISMALPVATNWNLTIYNVAGQKVAEFSGFAEAGINDVVWNDKTAASGIYFYKVSTDSGSMTKKMVLLK